MKKNQEITLQITGMTHDGNGVAHCEDIAVFVPDALLGENILAKILKVNKKIAYGKLLQILSPSPDRIQSDCPVCHQCGSCTYRHVSYSAELGYKTSYVKDCLRKFAGQYKDHPVPPTLASPQVDFYRNKAQYPVGTDNSGNLIYGYYAKNSHRIITTNQCQLCPSIFDEITRRILFFFSQQHIPSYNETTGQGVLRHICLRTAQSSGDIMLTIVATRKKIPGLADLCRYITHQFPQIKSIYLNINSQKTNVIYGKECIKLFGEDTIIDELCGVKLAISPLSFYQINRQSTQNLYTLVKEFAALQPNDILFDLYCGIGSIGLTMAKDVKHLYGVEIIPQAIQNAKQNAALNGFQNTTFLCGDCKDAISYFTQRQIRPTITILDPPRKGCDESVILQVAQLAPQKIVMVSCNPATMARDIDRFAQLGYTMQKLQPVDLFPRAPHVECVVLLTKAER